MKLPILLAALSLLSTSAALADTQSNNDFTPTKTQRQQMLKIILKEKSVLAADWASTHIINVGMLNRGGSYNGYAESLCMEISQPKFKGKRVFIVIVDYAKAAKDGTLIKIGEHFCNITDEPPTFIDFTKQK